MSEIIAFPVMGQECWIWQDEFVYVCGGCMGVGGVLF